eukprot:NODE_1640_length_1106_cov_45.387890_g1340_i0.p2 GENE.NODE_1640_length_1106_cov_45.387890_g1340_i0~~NODE_1640_length_1106_cov_45.387890_g1340_i0.p2  ORF type:complete len:189 (-),score=61.22 NODE_1640_length_1106_cov_45.387890_g1340_i0:48-614(-)
MLPTTTKKRFFFWGGLFFVGVGIINNASLVCIVWQTISLASDNILKQLFGTMMLVLFSGIMLHIVFLAINSTGLSLLRLHKNDFRCLLLITSQKTLPVAMAALSYMSTEEVGVKGLVAVPCIVGHLSQLFIDARLVAHWASAAREITEPMLSSPNRQTTPVVYADVVEGAKDAEPSVEMADMEAQSQH